MVNWMPNIVKLWKIRLPTHFWTPMQYWFCGSAPVVFGVQVTICCYRWEAVIDGPLVSHDEYQFIYLLLAGYWYCCAAFVLVCPKYESPVLASQLDITNHTWTHYFCWAQDDDSKNLFSLWANGSTLHSYLSSFCWVHARCNCYRFYFFCWLCLTLSQICTKIDLAWQSEGLFIWLNWMRAN